jgi:hypothetical protein
MKITNLALCLCCILFATGCSTPATVSKLEGRGTKRVYDVNFDFMWAAAHAAADMGNFEVVDADESTGYISTRRKMSSSTIGETVGIWVRKVTADKTEVEVVSRLAVPSVPGSRRREEHVLETISTLLQG